VDVLTGGLGGVSVLNSTKRGGVKGGTIPLEKSTGNFPEKSVLWVKMD